MRNRDGTASCGKRLRAGMTLAAALALIVALALVATSESNNAGTFAQASETADAAATASAESDAASDASASEDSDLAAAAAAYAKATPQESGQCLVCHTDADALQASLSDPEDDYTKYLVSEDFATSTHGMLGCTYCHGGHPDETDASAAMFGMNASPTADSGESVCATCHEGIVERYSTSLHNTTAGIENAWDARLSMASDNLGTDLASQYWHHEGYEGSCIDCHATCGECHVRGVTDALTEVYGPDTGLIDGHNFVDPADNENITYTCLYCHSSPIGTSFMSYDVHGTNGANMNCMDCHNIDEIHGDGTEYQTMSQSHGGAVTTECTDCHAADSLSGEWHSETHLDSNECWACHSTDYTNCWSCHGYFAPLRGDGEEMQEVMQDGCYLGYDTANGKITTLGKAPIGTGMLGDSTSLVLNDEDLNTGSTWYPGFVHGVIKPEVSQDFCNRCHGEGTDLLTEDDLQYPDYETELLVGSLPEVNVEDYVSDSGA
jgi:hypothetical protein